MAPSINAGDVYLSIRNEITANHTLMHWFTLAVCIIVFAGAAVVEFRRSILSIWLPLLSLAWAASMLRFDFFIHRQGTYLRAFEQQLIEDGVTFPLWEMWKISLQATKLVVSVTDVIACAVIVLPTIYILFGPAQEYFRTANWPGGRFFAWGISTLLIALLCSLAAVPRLAALGAPIRGKP